MSNYNIWLNISCWFAINPKGTNNTNSAAISNLMSVICFWKSDIVCENVNQEPTSRYLKRGKIIVHYVNPNLPQPIS